MKNCRKNWMMYSETYETELGYLEYESDSDRISIPIQLRERHLTPDARKASLQAIGTDLQIALSSERDDILVRVPFNEWRTSQAFSGTLTGNNSGLLSVGRFEDTIENDGEVVPATILVINLTNHELLR